jgi:hygromycin-B 7''-O-kinase
LSFLLPPIDTWAQWSSLFDDIAVWKPAVDAICEREGIAYDRIEAPASNTNAVFILDRRLVIKIYSPFWTEFPFERGLMELLARDGDVPVPAIRAAGVFRDRTDWSYLAMQFCAGHPLDELQPELTRQALLEMAAQTGRIVRRLHAVAREPLAAIDKGETWDALVQRRRRQVLPELIDRRLIAPHVAGELEAVLDDALVASRTVPHVVVHGDLNAEHLLLEEAGRWIVSALIDFGDARIGVPDYEWMPLWLGLCNRDVAVLQAFLEAYDPALSVDDRLGRRIAAWTLLHDFGTDAIAELFENSGAACPAPSLETLQALVWPGIWPARQISGARQRRTGGGTGTG